MFPSLKGCVTVRVCLPDTHVVNTFLPFLSCALILVSGVDDGNEHAHLITSFLPPCSEWEELSVKLVSSLLDY